jgi:hypothetical protein
VGGRGGRAAAPTAAAAAAAAGCLPGQAQGAAAAAAARARLAAAGQQPESERLTAALVQGLSGTGVPMLQCTAPAAAAAAAAAAAPVRVGQSLGLPEHQGPRAPGPQVPSCTITRTKPSQATTRTAPSHCRPPRAPRHRQPGQVGASATQGRRRGGWGATASESCMIGTAGCKAAQQSVQQRSSPPWSTATEQAYLRLEAWQSTPALG